MLTGRMAFRTGMRSVFVGVQSPCLMAADRLTLPQMLRDKGYTTACIGKWQVGNNPKEEGFDCSETKYEIGFKRGHFNAH